MDLLEYLRRQKAWSQRTFGPAKRTSGMLEHIRKELEEIEADPCALEEWIDVVILALDGAWRQGYSPAEIAVALQRKQEINILREWPDWREQSEDEAIEHIRDGDE